jgi:hypothetical protein
VHAADDLHRRRAGTCDAIDGIRPGVVVRRGRDPERARRIERERGDVVETARVQGRARSRHAVQARADRDEPAASAAASARAAAGEERRARNERGEEAPAGTRHAGSISELPVNGPGSTSEHPQNQAGRGGGYGCARNDVSTNEDAIHGDRSW